jgi:transcriptional regulator with XRE-family HTH domain
LSDGRGRNKRRCIGPRQSDVVDWIRLGLSLRALRIRRRWRQADVADRVGVSRSLISAVERGRAGEVTAATLVRIGAALEARVDISVRWRGEHLDRLLDAAHAGLVERVVELLASLGWDIAVEASFSTFGERGSIDVLARHRATGQVLVVEVKSVVPDSQAMLHGLDRKVRLAPAVARERGWTTIGPIARLLVIGDGSTSRRRIAGLGATYAAALPDRGGTVRRWLKHPIGPLSGLLFLPYADQRGTRATATGVTRVRTRRSGITAGRSTPSARLAGELEDEPQNIGPGFG